MSKSKRTKALEISDRTKMKVWERDGGCCVWCGHHTPFTQPEAHFIPRSKGGLGIEENILTLCRYSCHYRYDNGTAQEKEEMRERFRSYLKSKYPDWDEDKLIYRRY